MPRKPKEFWTSLPGILTAVGGIVTAAATLVVAIGGLWKTPSIPKTEPPPPGRGSRPPVEKVVAESPVATFSMPGWWTGHVVDEEGAGTFDSEFIGGKYRWTIAVNKPRARWAAAPVLTMNDFYAAVDFTVAERSGAEVSVGIAFGSVGDKQYEFVVLTNGTYGLGRRKGTDSPWEINPAPIQITVPGPTRIGVWVNHRDMTFYVNNKVVGSYHDDAYAGGKVALIAGGNGATAATVDFDNFEMLRRAPTSIAGDLSDAR